MREVITEDNSITYYNEEAQDHYHTKSGAREEAFEKHAKALKIDEVSNPVIYDMFFGLGYNAAAAIDILKDNVTIYCFENDKVILSKILELKADFESWSLIQDFVRGFLENNEKVFTKKNIKLIMLFGDALEEIKNVEEKADFVFFDPFSPAKVPQFWTLDFFKDVKDKMNSGGKLSTYSCARFVKDNFIEAGFRLEKGPIVGRRSPSTIAIKD
ncbi:hypothetical protein KY334_04680 [Candidatus Woesearchaeota archaeon]|nr:hypothetical protein [Candidatus Woesearchaeota archaeon]